MKILFLDIDGVLNCDESQRAAANQFEYMEHVPDELYGPSQLDRSRIGLLNQVVDATGCKLVVSSTWRQRYIIGELNALLRSQGLKGNLYRYTPRPFQLTPGGAWSKRGDEIESWLSTTTKEITSWAAVDDDAVKLADPSRLVRTDLAFGLEQPHVEALIKLLGPGEFCGRR